MKDIDEFARLAIEQHASIRVRAQRSPDEEYLQPDALLQTPLIALCLLIVAQGSRLGIEAGHTASLTSAIFAEYFVGLGDARGRLAWSPAMRIKCADALADLEAMGLVEVEGLPRRFLLTEQGKHTLRAAFDDWRSEIGKLAHGLRRTYENVEAVGFKLL